MAISALCSELVRRRACWRHTKTRQRSRRSDFANLRFKTHLQSVADGVAESSRTTGCDRAWTRRKDQNARPVRRQCLRFRITKGYIRCQYHRFGDPGHGTGVVLTQHGRFRGCLPDRPHRLDASRCSLDTVLDERTYARTMSLIHKTSKDYEQQQHDQSHTRTVRCRNGHGRRWCTSQRQRIEIQHTSGRRCCRARVRVLDDRREHEIEIPPARSHSGGIIQTLTKFDGLAQQGTRCARVAETQGSAAELMQRPGFGGSIAYRPRRVEASVRVRRTRRPIAH